jgi:2-keto-4-pentenoate hydratase/2-oxohepta-3-ene-1,7-dioic acid hydratase in catechol pathway
VRLVTFASADKRERLGLVEGDVIREVMAGAGGDPMLAFISLPGDERRRVLSGTGSAPAHALRDVEIRAPIPRPRRNVFCVGKNYHDHAAEFHASGFDTTSRAPRPEYPVFFTKATTSVIGPGEPIRSGLDPTATIDYEGELAVVIGSGGRGIPAGRAMDHVFGYTLLNDVTSRELQRRHGQWFLGKSLDSFGPMGPYLVTADEIGDPAGLRLTVEVNGEVRQRASVSDLIFGTADLIACLSAAVTLLPGDIIATGTPAGVGIGFSPPRYLSSGDTVTVRVDGIGSLSNPVV